MTCAQSESDRAGEVGQQLARELTGSRKSTWSRSRDGGELQSPLLARMRATTVNLEVVTSVVLTYSTRTKPALFITSRRSRTGIAPPIQSDQASRLLATSAGRSSRSTISANWKHPPGFRTRKISLKLSFFNSERFRTPLEITTSKVQSS